MWATTPGSFGAEVLARTGVDYVCVYQQHELIGYDASVPMFQAIAGAGAAPTTRVLSGDPYRIMKALDAGAWGVIVPMIESSEDAARVAADAASSVSCCAHP